jgi:predicted O-linked N-acetylglucosamine transferase (SPINDLY family)
MATVAETLALAVEHHQAGYLDAAEQLYRQILAAYPDEADAWNLLGVIHTQRGRHEAGIECIQRALALRPDWSEGLYNLGWALFQQRKFEDAAACYRRAIELKPEYAEAHDNLGLALQGEGKLDEAVACHRRALELKPDFAAAHNNLGLALQGQQKLEQAAACYRKALQLRPDFLKAQVNLGNIWTAQGKYAQAVACLQRALQLQPDAAAAHCSLGNALGFSGKPDEAVACFRRALQLNPHDPRARSAALFMTQYRTSVTLKELAEAHAEYEQAHAAPLRATWRPHQNARDPRRRLRVGFLSGDLRRHPVGYFLIRLLENLDQGQCEAICYDDGTAKDDFTARFQAAARAWSEVRGWTDEQVAEQIRADRIDILFDLAGHAEGSRLLVFARKPAPIQVTWAGYAGTTGVAAMDYILADRYEIPAESESYYRERVVRMPDGYVCYDPPEYAPPVSPLPALDSGYVTFAAFHNPAKITPQVVEVWARVLNRLPRARLVLKYRGMDDVSVGSRLADLFAAQGIEPGRLEFLGFSDHRETLSQYQRVDVALDSFPYSGGLTTCEALWMGVPVITCPGETFASRHSLSHLANVGLAETIAGSLEEYVEVAASLAGDLARLAALRAGLRERVASSPLCDGKRFAANFAEVLRAVWRRWCETSGQNGAG